MYVLRKIKNIVSGIAYECKISEIQTVLKTDFWGNQYPPLSSSKSIEINKELCKQLVQTRSCENIAMHCELTGCYSTSPDFSNQYTWWTEKIVKSTRCSFVQKSITGTSLTDNLFTSEVGKCTANDEYCVLPDSIVIWNSTDVIHKCPYEIISDLPFRRYFGNLLECRNHGLAFEITGKEEACRTPRGEGFFAYSTTEGYFLSERDSQARSLVKHSKSNEIVYSNLLLLADIDSFKADSLRVYRELNQRNCYSILNYLNLVANSRHDYYFKIKDIEGNDLVLYTINKQVYIPNCKRIKTIAIDVNETRCFEYTPIIVEIQNSTQKLFLSQNKIIRKMSKLIVCEQVEHTELIVNQSTQIFTRKYQNNSLMYSLNSNNKQFEYINIINNNISYFNFKHHEKLIYNLDYNNLEEKNIIYSDGRYFQSSIEPVIPNNFKSHVSSIIQYLG